MKSRDRVSAQPKSKNPSLLDEVLERRMLLYVLAAGATLAGASVAQAKVVFTPSNAVVGTGGVGALQIDINNDGNFDFTLAAGYNPSCFSSHGKYCIYGLGAIRAQQSNRVIVSSSGQAPLRRGQNIGSSGNFRSSGGMLRIGSFTSIRGPWDDVKDRFLGVEFVVNGQTHYGWIGFRRVTARLPNEIVADLAGWAYETVPNKPIIAGDKGEEESSQMLSAEPTSLELLALGHTAIAERQRRIAA